MWLSVGGGKVITIHTTLTPKSMHTYTSGGGLEGNLIEEYIDNFRPYFWIRAETSDSVVNNVLNRYPGSSIDRNDTAVALKTEEDLVKVYAYRQSNLRSMKLEFDKTWEADLSLTDRYLIDEIKEMPEWKPHCGTSI